MDKKYNSIITVIFIAAGVYLLSQSFAIIDSLQLPKGPDILEKAIIMAVAGVGLIGVGVGYYIGYSFAPKSDAKQSN